MPELPEVETVRRGVEALYLGETLARLTLAGKRTVRRHGPEVLACLERKTLVGVSRHGKYLLLHWDSGEVLVVHLRMSGQLLTARAGDPMARHTHAVLLFGGGSELRFVDPRTFGELFVASLQPCGGWIGGTGGLDGLGVLGVLGVLGNLGPDALDAEPGYLAAAFARRRAPLKSLLVDQRVLAGIGNIYADEICFDAQARPDRPGSSLRSGELERLAGSICSVLRAAIDAGGSTLGDRQYRDVYGNAGTYQLLHKVYGRSGQPCLSCGARVERVRFGVKGAYWCPACQH